MNLHGLVSGAIGAVNPLVAATVRQSTGYTTNSDGSRVPTYTTFGVSVQPQALTYTDLVKLDGLNITGIRRAIYLNVASGDVEGAVRAQQSGGDVLTFPSGTFPEGNVWLAAYVLEHWPDWEKIALTLQNNS